MYTSRVARRYSNHATVADIRRTWAVVSVDPQLSLRAMAAQLGIGYSRVGAALRLLKDAGYIDFPKGTERARTVLIPFVVMTDDPAIPAQ